MSQSSHHKKKVPLELIVSIHCSCINICHVGNHHEDKFGLNGQADRGEGLQSINAVVVDGPAGSSNGCRLTDGLLIAHAVSEGGHEEEVAGQVPGIVVNS